ncbi:MAG TPA: copper oxidase [Polyangiales bacterium]|jgi:FtsP/CotA-like multicopper oxidase with cupredoxin domain|nr:copper oxidase [Polyangiales bacterium]
MDRRDFLQLAGVTAGVSVLGAELAEAQTLAQAQATPAASTAHLGYRPVVTPNGSTLAWKTSGNVKVGHLIANAFDHEFAPGLRAECWGYNGSTPGPTLELVEGDRMRMYVTNRLPEATSVHWHGVPVPNGMDGVAGLTQRAIEPGETFKYEFTFTRAGTFMYHPHFDEMTQMALGMMGMIVVHPRAARGARVDRDFVLMTHEWDIKPGTHRPNPNTMTDFNVLTFNSKAFPATDALVVKRGERVRIRLGNVSAMDHHPIHLHGHSFKVVATDGGDVPASAQFPETTVLVPVGTTRTLELVADLAGDWPMHCHMTHHVMTQMGHDAPNMIGADPKRMNQSVRAVVPSYMAMGGTGMGEMGAMRMPVPENSIPMQATPGPFGRIDMGGMFTILKVREDPTKEDGHGWYAHPKGSVAEPASEAELAADGIDLIGSKG